MERMLRDNYKGCRCCCKTIDARADDKRRTREEITADFMEPSMHMTREEYWEPYGGDPMFYEGK